MNRQRSSDIVVEAIARWKEHADNINDLSSSGNKIPTEVASRYHKAQADLLHDIFLHVRRMIFDDGSAFVIDTEKVRQ